MSEKILVVSPRYWPETVKINDICAGIVKNGYRVDVICGQPNYPVGEFFEGYHSYGNSEEKKQGVRILRHAETKRGSGSGFRVMLNYLVTSFAASSALRRVKKRKYEAVLIYQTSPVMACTAGLKAAKKRKIPAVIYAVDIWPDSLFHELDMQSPILRTIFRSISRKKYQAADEIVTQNGAAQQYFVKELDIHPGRVWCIPPGPCSFADKEPEDEGLRERYYGSFNIMVFDDTLKKQDYDTLLKSAGMIRDRGLINIRIVVVCSVNTASLKRKISTLGLDDIVFAERKKEGTTAAYLRIANAFLSCEKTSAGDEYSFPGDVIDYLSVAKPVIFAGDGEGRKIVREAGCGKTCDPEDPEALYRAIMELYGSGKDEWKRLGEAGLSYQQENYGMDTCVDRLLEVLLRKGGSAEDEFLINNRSGLIRADDLFEEPDDEE